MQDATRPITTTPSVRDDELIAVIGELVRELHPQRARFIEVGPSSHIERDLGIDSLARTELILRIERAFRVRLPAQTVGEADTVDDLLAALRLRPTAGRPRAAPRACGAPPAPGAGGERSPHVDRCAGRARRTAW